MNIYLSALISAVGAMVVGFLFYGLFFKSAASQNTNHTPTAIVMSIIGIYIACLGFTVLYTNTTFAIDTPAMLRGLYLGLLTGVTLFAIPLYTDQGYLAPKSDALWVVLMNWVVSFAVVGLLTGLLVH